MFSVFSWIRRNSARSIDMIIVGHTVVFNWGISL